LQKLTTALILSIFVLPGAGHWYLGLKRTALGFGLLALSCALYLSYSLFGIVRQVREQMMSGALPLQIDEIQAKLEALLVMNAGFEFKLATVLLLLTWIIAAADAVRQCWQRAKRDNTSKTIK